MSAVPPGNLAGSILQSHLVQRQASTVRNGDEAGRADAARRQTSAIDEKDTTVGTADGDTQVHTDAEGTGSQGRAFSESEEQPNPEDTPKPPPLGDEGHHLDLQA